MSSLSLKIHDTGRFPLVMVTGCLTDECGSSTYFADVRSFMYLLALFFLLQSPGSAPESTIHTPLNKSFPTKLIYLTTLPTIATKVTRGLAILFLSPLGSLAHIQSLHVRQAPHDRLLHTCQSSSSSSSPYLSLSASSLTSERESYFGVIFCLSLWFHDLLTPEHTDRDQPHVPSSKCSHQWHV